MSNRLIKLNNGKTISSIGFGTYDLPSRLTTQIVYDAAKVGYRHFDTAVLYGNEAEVGQGILKWIDEGNSRKDVFYTTKLWNSQLGYKETTLALKSMLDKVAGLEYIDMVLIHSPLPGKERRLGSWKALQEAVDQGFVKSIGVLNYGIKHLEELLSWPDLKYKPVVNQIEISPWCMRQQLADWCHDHDIAVEAFSPLTHGYRLTHPDADFSALMKKYNVSMAQLLIKWSLQKGYIPLPKTKTTSRIKENFEIDGFELTPQEIETISHPEVHDPTDWECTDAP